MPCSTPVAFLIFRRPDLTARVFEAIRQAQPKKLFVIADGPRNEEENVLCQHARAVTENVNWDCEVLRNYSSINLGCKKRVCSGLDWAFENSEELIILEDDCLPNPSFFQYCTDLLKRHRNDQRIMLISGFNKQGVWKDSDNDYFFSNLGGIWGWASWRRAWKLNDPEMSDLEEFASKKYFEYLLGFELGNIRKKQMLSIAKNSESTWDFQWGFSRHKNSGLACVPSKNLVKNIGFRHDSTHTFRESFKHPKVYSLSLPIRTNKFIVPDHDYDVAFFQKNERNLAYILKLNIKKAKKLLFSR
ncbi:hemolytic protein HlpA-like protein [Phormidium tenue]|uniref:Hemolytic protein HlpA-like protein n=1 Tax=Phormidium tenue NIES-30 TaxID=549789 RepID=A0A1U7JBB9_9CYAN|nr:hemolytic protein HlpA-like protein [Phormidium tenue]MBD2230083.1 glycosyltransferase family 2 protein [Phormidium tenue FACHB-1052]OKH51078.1 hemolytic protein HlpA-like protein [Phormidium tenue NIES-30]